MQIGVADKFKIHSTLWLRSCMRKESFFISWGLKRCVDVFCQPPYATTMATPQRPKPFVPSSSLAITRVFTGRPYLA